MDIDEAEPDSDSDNDEVLIGAAECSQMTPSPSGPLQGENII